ncbi:hypothetical protein ACFL2X_05315 [Candidatus Latescibacterota bacterium]
MKNNLRITHIFLLFVLLSLLIIQTVFSNFVICLGDDGHVNVDISITEDKLATNHHINEHNEMTGCTDDTILLSAKHSHGCYDILFSFSAELAKFNAKSDPALNDSECFLSALPSHTDFDSVAEYSVKSYPDTSVLPGITLYLSGNISLLI